MLKTIKKITSHPCLSCKQSAFDGICGDFSCSSSRLTSNFLPIRNNFRAFYVLSNGCLFNSTQRVLAASDNYHVPIEKANELNYFWEDYSRKLSFKRRCINKVCTLLNCDEKDAVELVDEHPILFLEDIDNTMENVQLLIENGVPSETIRTNIWLLYYDHATLTFQIESVKLWGIRSCTLNDLLNLFKLSPADFEKVSNVFISEKEEIPYGNRIVYLSNLLKVSVPELTSRLVRHKYLLVRNMELILATIKSYTDFGISEQELVDDIWALRYTEPVVRRRLRIVEENGLPFLKPWYVRCSEENFEKMLEANKIEKDIMHPFQTREEFLANKLGIEFSVMKHVVQKNIIFKKIHITKLVEMVDYLIENGFKGTDICSGSRIFYFSLETTMERVNELKSLGVQEISICVLIKNQTDYQKFVDRIKYIASLKKKC